MTLTIKESLDLLNSKLESSSDNVEQYRSQIKKLYELRNQNKIPDYAYLMFITDLIKKFNLENGI